MAKKLSAREKQLAKRILARRRLDQFVLSTYPEYRMGWVHADICRRRARFSDRVIAGESPRLMLLCPPRHGKSELASIRFPSWHLGRAPNHEIINSGYNLDLPMKFSRAVRGIFKTPMYQGIFPGAQLSADSQSVEAWMTQAGGGFTAAGVGGGITGKGAHVLIVDDPIKNQEEADSIATRDKLWDWYQSTAYTRLAPGAGVLVIECMTGDTPVLMPNGTERRLDSIRPNDVIATYENGRMSTARVAAQRSSGDDSILKITTKSGKVVRANGRHPFLATTATGELKWIRARSLSTANKIVAVKGSEESGREWPALLRGASYPLSAEGCVLATTTKRSGQTDTAPHPTTRSPDALRTSSTGTASRSPSTTGFWPRRTIRAPSAETTAVPAETPSTGPTYSQSTTATPPAKCADCCATTATQESDILELSPSHSPLYDTSDFTLDDVVSIEEDGVEEVFDVQVDRTTNFIANGVVASNTWWNDDDLAGRLQALAAESPGADQFEVVKYPAISDFWEYRDKSSLAIERFEEEQDDPRLHLLRPANSALHEDRYPIDALERIRNNLQPRIWSALYQQNPVPDGGAYFRKEDFRFEPASPSPVRANVYTAWDFAITTKQTSDWTVGATILQDADDTIHAVDMNRFRGDTREIVTAIIDTAVVWGSRSDVTYRVGVEDGQIWRAVEPILRDAMRERKVTFPIEVLRPLTDKLARARPLQGRMQQGRFILPDNKPWATDAAHEMLRFPAGAHDDIVDALSWAVRLCMDHRPPRKPSARRQASWKDQLLISSHVGESHMAA